VSRLADISPVGIHHALKGKERKRKERKGKERKERRRSVKEDAQKRKTKGKRTCTIIKGSKTPELRRKKNV
jgi:hypothetical protein